jgi:ferric-dicitrate binding protein FerR (iron transport regulator)
MDDRRLDHIEEELADAPDSEQNMSALFARYLPSDPLPPDLVERTQRIVLSEVRRTIRPAVSAQPAASWNEQLRRWWRSLTPAQSLAMSGAVAAVALVCVVSLTQLAPQNTAATVVVHEGVALVLRDENNSYRSFFADDMLKVDQGDHIITGQSSAFLQPFDDQRAVLDAGTHVEIMALEDDFGATQVEYLIHRGSLHNVIDDQLEAGDRYVVHSPLLSVSALGTDFTVRTLVGTDTLVTVTSGVVTVQMDEEVVEVAAGQYLHGRSGVPLQVETGTPGEAGSEATLVVADIDDTPLPVYAAPSADAAVIGAISASTSLRIDDRDGSGNWLLVCCVDDRSGWVNIAELDGNLSPATAAPAPDAPAILETTPAASPPSP